MKNPRSEKWVHASKTKTLSTWDFPLVWARLRIFFTCLMRNSGDVRLLLLVESLSRRVTLTCLVPIHEQSPDSLRLQCYLALSDWWETVANAETIVITLLTTTYAGQRQRESVQSGESQTNFADYKRQIDREETSSIPHLSPINPLFFLWPNQANISSSYQPHKGKKEMLSSFHTLSRWSELWESTINEDSGYASEQPHIAVGKPLTSRRKVSRSIWLGDKWDGCSGDN